MDDKNINGPFDQPEYQHRLEKKIDNILEISDLKDKHPYEDYENFETSTRRPGYFRNPVRTLIRYIHNDVKISAFPEGQYFGPNYFHNLIKKSGKPSIFTTL